MQNNADLASIKTSNNISITEKNMTNVQWQRFFKSLKNRIPASKYKKMSTINESNNPIGYYGKTQYQCYCSFINDILKNIRSGNTDYCYHIYQIEELLKYEHNRLRTFWNEDELYFGVWLED